MHLLMQGTWGHIWKHTLEKNQTNATNVTCILSSKQFKDTSENTQWRKVQQMQSMWLCILAGMPFEDAFEKTQWRKIIQLQPMWLCILYGRPFEEAFENAQWGRVKKCNQCNYASSRADYLRSHLVTHRGENHSNVECNQWHYTTFVHTQFE